MHNGWTTVISSIGVGGANTVNYFHKTWGRIAPACAMDLYSLDKFKKYKNDWNCEYYLTIIICVCIGKRSLICDIDFVSRFVIEKLSV